MNVNRTALSMTAYFSFMKVCIMFADLGFVFSNNSFLHRHESA